MDRQTQRFFLLAFGWTWGWQTPVMLGLQGPAALVCLGLAAIGPTLAAIVITRGSIVRELRWRCPAGWLLVALALPIAIRGAALALWAGSGHPLPDALIVMPALGGLLVPPLGEELGWRGLSYRRVADRHGRVRAGLLTGAAWAVWHVPISLALGSGLEAILSYLVLVTAGGVWMAWIYERSGRSITAPIVAHMAINAGLLAIVSGPALAIVGLGVAALTGFDLTRTKLSPRARVASAANRPRGPWSSPRCPR